MKDLEPVEISSIWKRPRSGELVRVESIDYRRDIATLRRPAGGVTTLPLATLVTLYAETLESGDSDRFGDVSIDPEPVTPPPPRPVRPLLHKWANRRPIKLGNGGRPRDLNAIRYASGRKKNLKRLARAAAAD